MTTHNRLQDRIDAMYVDKLDGRIDTNFFDRKSAEWREEQRKCLALIREHQDSNQTYLDEGIRLLELAQKAGTLFRKQSSAEKRRLLGFVLSNCTWKNGQLTAAYRQPIELLEKNLSWKRKGRLSALEPAFLIDGSPGRTRTSDQLINSQSLYQLSYRGIVGIVESAADRRYAARAGILVDSPPPSQGDSARFRRRTASSSISSEHA